MALSYATQLIGAQPALRAFVLAAGFFTDLDFAAGFFAEVAFLPVDPAFSAETLRLRASMRLTTFEGFSAGWFFTGLPACFDFSKPATASSYRSSNCFGS